VIFLQDVVGGGDPVDDGVACGWEFFVKFETISVLLLITLATDGGKHQR